MLLSVQPSPNFPFGCWLLRGGRCWRQGSVWEEVSSPTCLTAVLLPHFLALRSQGESLGRTAEIRALEMGRKVRMSPAYSLISFRWGGGGMALVALSSIAHSLNGGCKNSGGGSHSPPPACPSILPLQFFFSSPFGILKFIYLFNGIFIPPSLMNGLRAGYNWKKNPNTNKQHPNINLKI